MKRIPTIKVNPIAPNTTTSSMNSTLKIGLRSSISGGKYRDALVKKNPFIGALNNSNEVLISHAPPVVKTLFPIEKVETNRSE